MKQEVGDQRRGLRNDRIRGPRSWVRNHRRVQRGSEVSRKGDTLCSLREVVITRLVTSNNNCYGKGSDLAKMGDPYGAHREVGLPSYPVGKTLITFVMERDPIWQRSGLW